ncbi:uncharacterized protein DUF4393 [Herbihabitans rhizosphaerae]|uniref:Uncharacterized protein DUF4393 n=1 Tax=Herbihabitans rhizosphaerae TaxID=1872711 RepID=A0A4Q7KWP0_9PSEU|nr:Abi-alpha family protein [Herbihabitans rhizosphaerae]RZS41087.1 uncharacterized protein DUF4393 [Herbihabitans rhizosphaerae]
MSDGVNDKKDEPGHTMEIVGEVVRGTPGLVKLAFGAWVRGATWVVRTTVNTSTDIARDLANGEPPATVIRKQTSELRTIALRALGMREDNGDQPAPRPAPTPRRSPTVGLADQGKELLRRSADVRFTVDTHPAYARILADLTPDEARILRYIFMKGPQPSIDIRTNRPLGIGSELIGSGLNMIAEFAGCTYVDRIHPYLTNLNRLGLVEFSKEKVPPHRYQLIEAQPKTTAVMKQAGRAPKIVHRSILLSRFGEDFCTACLPTDGYGFTRPEDADDDGQA